MINTTRTTWEERNQLIDFINTIPKITYNQFLSIMSFLNLIFNNDDVDILDKFYPKDIVIKKINQELTNEKLQDKNKKHDTYLFEKQLINYVSNGNVLGLNSFFNKEALNKNFNIGKVAETQLRQEKNLFLGLIAVIGKEGAIKGGMDIEQAYSLIDLYSVECERCQTIDQIYNLRYNALVDFTTKVAQSKHLNKYSIEVSKAYEFIKNHTTDNIQILDIVKAVGCSRTKLLTMFKNETNESLGRSILIAKLDDAKNMLLYTDKKLNEISETLCFSSQSYFQNTFKKEYGITPLEFRKQNKIR